MPTQKNVYCTGRSNDQQQQHSPRRRSELGSRQNIFTAHPIRIERQAEREYSDAPLPPAYDSSMGSQPRFIVSRITAYKSAYAHSLHGEKLFGDIYLIHALRLPPSSKRPILGFAISHMVECYMEQLFHCECRTVCQQVFHCEYKQVRSNGLLCCCRRRCRCDRARTCRPYVRPLQYQTPAIERSKTK
jgi:hypothetical protein